MDGVSERGCCVWRPVDLMVAQMLGFSFFEETYYVSCL